MSNVKASTRFTATGGVYESIIQVKSAVLNTEYQISNPNGNYYRTPLAVTVVAKRPNSVFYIRADIQGYSSTGFSNGWNIGIAKSYNTGTSYSSETWQQGGPYGITGGGDTLIAGVDLGNYNGSQPEDMWMGFAHNNGVTTSSWSKNRTAIDEARYAQGTSITYTVYLGGWTSSGNLAMGWSSYTANNRITVFEFAK